MSRSRRKTPKRGWTTSKSEKRDKQIWHRRFRRIIREEIKRGFSLLTHFREISDPWLMDKDGKCWTRDEKDLRK